MTTQLTWLGHGTWLIETGAHTILLDPFLDESPVAPRKAADVRPDFLLVSHGHFDHIADAVAIARRTGATAIGIYEICAWLAEQGVSHTHAMNLGGSYVFPFGRVKLTPAWHSSTLPDGRSGGSPVGFVLTLPEGKVYFACDTALFSDMRLIGEEGLELAVLPIGDNFTMGPDDSIRAIRFLQPRKVVPAHYNTWPPIAQDAEQWARRVRSETQSFPHVPVLGAPFSL